MQHVQANGNHGEYDGMPPSAASETPITDALRVKESRYVVRKDGDEVLSGELSFRKSGTGIRVEIDLWILRKPGRGEFKISDATIVIEVTKEAEKAVWELLALDRRPFPERLVELKELAVKLNLAHEIEAGDTTRLEDEVGRSTAAAGVILAWAPEVIGFLSQAELAALADEVEKIETRFPSVLKRVLALSDQAALEDLGYLAKSYVEGLASGPRKLSDDGAKLVLHAIGEDGTDAACRRAISLLAEEYDERSGIEKTALAFFIFERSSESEMLKRLLTTSVHAKLHRDSIEHRFRNGFDREDNQCLSHKLEVVSVDQIRRLLELGLIDEAGAASWALSNEQSQEEISSDLGAAITTRFAERPMSLPSWLARKVDFSKAADEMIQAHGVNALACNFEYFRTLPPRFAMAAVEAGFAAQVIGELRSFKLHNGEFGKLAQAVAERGEIDQIVRRISDMPDSALKSLEDSHGLLTFKRTIGAPSSAAYAVFSDAFTRGGIQGARLAALELLALTRQVLTAQSTSDEVRANPLYTAAIELAYPDNSRVDFKQLEACSDRSADLELFEVQSRYEIDLADGVTMQLRPGLETDQAVINRLHGYIRRSVQISDEFSAEPERLHEKMRSELSGLQPDGNAAKGSEAQLLAQAILDVQPNSAQAKRVKHLVCMAEAAADSNFTRYTHASRSRIEGAGNRAYAELRELREFVASRLIDRVSSIAEEAAPGDRIKKLSVIAAARTLFAEDLALMDRELKKFSAHEGEGKNLPLAAFITKSAASAAMRRVTGVCVAGDNPADGGIPDGIDMWNMENYLQVVLVDTEKMRCEGGVLMHYYEEQGKRILTAAINPCSTLLYKCDQKLLFKQIMGVLEKFALDNDIDLICMSTNPEIRTNRSDGDFENAMLERAREVHEKFSLKSEEIFSYEPEYYQKEFDVLWRRAA